MHRSRRKLAAAAAAAAVAGSVLAAAPAGAVPDRMPKRTLDFRGEATLPAQLSFDGTEVGGLSSITYDEQRDLYYAVSDGRPELGQGPFRLYTLRIDAADGVLSPGDVTVLDVTVLTDADGEPFAPGSLDPEGLALGADDTLVLTSEGLAAAVPAVAPRVLELDLSGRLIRELDLPAYVDPVPEVSGVRNNLGLESAAFSPNQRFLYTGFENALVQDGPVATLASGSPVRLLRYHTRSGKTREYVYETDPVAVAPVPAEGFTVSGLVEVLPLGGRTLLTMERSFSLPASNTIRLYLTRLSGATDVSGVADLDDVRRLRTAEKTLLLDLDALGLTLDNIEGMTLGPRLPDGRRALLLVSDNNFTPGQPSQFLLFAAPKLK